MHALPAEPRCWFLGSAPSTFTSRWREVLIHHLGGLLPVWRGGVGIEQHVASARAVVANGAVFAQMPEGTVSGPPGRLGAMRTGWAIIAMRTDAPVVPLAMAGTEELYLGRRMASQVLAPTTARALAGLPDDAPFPEPGSREELALARVMTEHLAADPRPGGRGAPPVDDRPAGAPATPAQAPDLAAAAARPPGPDRLTAYRTASRPWEVGPPILGRDAVRRVHPRPRRPHAARPDHPRRSRPRPGWSASRSCSPSWRCSTPAARSRTASACR